MKAKRLQRTALLTGDSEGAMVGMLLGFNDARNGEGFLVGSVVGTVLGPEVGDTVGAAEGGDEG